MNESANLNLRLFPIFELGLAGCDLFVPLSQNIRMPCRSLERVWISVQIFEGHSLRGRKIGMEECYSG
jgi:hypothetical protein